MSNQHGISIDLYDPKKHDLSAITSLLHRAYAPLAKMGFNYVAADQSDEVTKSRLEDGIAYIACDQNQIIGTVTYYPQVPAESDHPDIYKLPDVAHFGQFAVLPDVQRRGIGNLLMDCIERKAFEDGMQQIACDTSEGAAHLIAYYERRGYKKVGFQQWPHAVYRSVILSKKLN